MLAIIGCWVQQPVLDLLGMFLIVRSVRHKQQDQALSEPLPVSNSTVLQSAKAHKGLLQSGV